MRLSNWNQGAMYGECIHSHLILLSRRYRPRPHIHHRCSCSIEPTNRFKQNWFILTIQLHILKSKADFNWTPQHSNRFKNDSINSTSPIVSNRIDSFLQFNCTFWSPRRTSIGHLNRAIVSKTIQLIEPVQLQSLIDQLFQPDFCSDFSYL